MVRHFHKGGRPGPLKSGIRRIVMKKNISAAVLAASLSAVLALTGCGSSGSQSSTSSSSTSETVVDSSSTEGSSASAETASSGDVTVIKAATTGGPSPYITVGSDNVPTGSDIEILEEVFKRLPQYDLQIDVTDDPLTGLTAGQYDLAVNNYNYREERGETYYFSYPYKKGYDVYIQRIGDEPLTGLQDLADRGYKTEVGAGSNKALAIEQWNEENPDHQIELIYSEADFQLKFQHIIDGTTDVAIDDGPILDTLIGQFGMENDLVGNPIDDDTQKFISGLTYTYFLFPKDDHGDALRKDIDEQIQAIYDDGTLKDILVKWFGRDMSPEADALVTPN